MSMGFGPSLRGSDSILLAQGGAAVAHTGNTTETTLATITVPAGLMGANGQIVIEAFWSGSPGSANSKTGRIKFGGTTFRTVAITADLSVQGRARINNRNSVSSQVCFPAGAEFTSSGSGPTTGVVNTAADVTVLITGQLALGTETVTLESYSVRVEPKS